MRLTVDSPVCLFLVFRALKWVLAKQHNVQHDTARPDISHHAIIVLLVGDDLGSCISTNIKVRAMQVLELA